MDGGSESGRARRRLVLHIGPHKAASTSVQHGLRMAADALAESGVAYFPSGPGVPFGIWHGQENLARSAFGHAQEPNRATWAGLLAHLATTEHPVTVASCEAFSVATPEQVRRLAADLAAVPGRPEVTIVYILRQHAGWVNSGFAQSSIGEMNTRIGRAWVDRRLKINPVFFGNHRARLGPWLDVFGREAVRTILLEDRARPPAAAVLAAAGVVTAPGLLPDTKLNTHFAPSIIGLNIAVSRLLEGLIEPQLYHAHVTAEIRRATTRAAAPASRSFFFSAEDYAPLRPVFETDCDWLEGIGVALPPSYRDERLPPLTPIPIPDPEVAAVMAKLILDAGIERQRCGPAPWRFPWRGTRRSATATDRRGLTEAGRRLQALRDALADPAPASAPAPPSPERPPPPGRNRPRRTTRQKA